MAPSRSFRNVRERIAALQAEQEAHALEQAEPGNEQTRASRTGAPELRDEVNSASPEVVTTPDVQPAREAPVLEAPDAPAGPEIIGATQNSDNTAVEGEVPENAVLVSVDNLTSEDFIFG